MDVDALAKTKGGKKGGKGKDKSNKPEKFDGNCTWCCEYGHTVEECRKKAAGKPKTAQSPRASDPKHKGKGKGVKGKKGAPSLDEWPGDQTPSEKSKEYAEVAGLFIVLSTDVRSVVTLFVLPVLCLLVSHPRSGCKNRTGLPKSTLLRTVRKFESLVSRFLHSSSRMETCRV